jgi:hypothetical protein
VCRGFTFFAQPVLLVAVEMLPFRACVVAFHLRVANSANAAMATTSTRVAVKVCRAIRFVVLIAGASDFFGTVDMPTTNIKTNSTAMLIAIASLLIDVLD